MKSLLNSLKLPYVFAGLNRNCTTLPTNGFIVKRIMSDAHLGLGVHKQFCNIYSDVLQAISENDREFLKSIMEKRLYERTISGIDELLENDLQVNYSSDPNAVVGEEIISLSDGEEEATTEKDGKKQEKIFVISDEELYVESDITVSLQAHAIFGARINRDENSSRSPIQLSGRMTARTYYVDFMKLSSLYYDQIIALNVTFDTTRKLYITDNNNEILLGDDDSKKLALHQWRFESYSPNFDWVLTDMDLSLNSNPHFKKE